MIWVFSPQRSHRRKSDLLNSGQKRKMQTRNYCFCTFSAMYKPQFTRNFESVVTGNHLTARKLVSEENIWQNMFSRETRAPRGQGHHELHPGICASFLAQCILLWTVEYFESLRGRHEPRQSKVNAQLSSAG